MKKILITYILILLLINSYGQGETSTPPNFSYFNIGLNFLKVNAIPGEIEVDYADEEFGFQDSIFLYKNTNKLNTFGFNVDLVFPIKDVYTLHIDNYFGFNLNQGSFSTIIHAVGVGRQIMIKNFRLVPSLSIGQVRSSMRLGTASGFKGYLIINDKLLLNPTTARLKTRAWIAKPSFSIDYPLNRVLCLYGKVSGSIVLTNKSFVTFTGELEETGSEGQTLYTTERVHFEETNLLMQVNGEILEDRNSNNIHYHFRNSQLFEVGVTINLSTLVFDLENFRNDLTEDIN